MVSVTKENTNQNSVKIAVDKKPIIAITMGDPSGVGPEIVTKTLFSLAGNDIKPKVIIIGDPNVMNETKKVIVAGGISFRPINQISEAKFSWPVFDVLCPDGASVKNLQLGKVSADMGRAAAICLEYAANLANKGLIDGLVSAPLHKEAFHLSGYEYRDELEFLAKLTNSNEPFIAGVVDKLMTITIAEHIPFKDILGNIKKDRILSRILLLDEALRRAGIIKPRIGVAALNVHGGDGGLFGNEEILEIEPAINEAKKLNVMVYGPIPADSIFVNAFSGKYDGVVSMYHDQANIARKLQPKSIGATLFLGLPVMCATTAHGTAFDIAGKGIADNGSLATALKWTNNLAVPHNVDIS